MPRQAFDHKGRSQRFHDTAGCGLSLGLAGNAGQQESELIAAEPRQQTPVRRHAGQPSGSLAKQNVAGAMPQRVVDRFEVIQIEADQTYTPAGLYRKVQRFSNNGVEHETIGQAS